MTNVQSWHVTMVAPVWTVLTTTPVCVGHGGLAGTVIPFLGPYVMMIHVRMEFVKIQITRTTTPAYVLRVTRDGTVR